MRKQLQEYHHHGVKASIEMQRASQEVAKENQRLRFMLALRGVLPEEIQDFLGLPDETVKDLALKCDISASQRTERSCISNHDAEKTRENGDGSCAEDTEATSMETSCITAAGIISEICGHRDAAQTLAALGCTDNKDCLVKNVKVFQVMSDSI